MDEAEVLVRLLRRYSPSGHEAAAVGEFVSIARGLGYSVRKDAVGNGWARRGRGTPHVLFLGHIDTVEGRRPVVRRGGRIRGRGAVDAKGPLAAALVAGAASTGPGRITVVAAVGEETDSRGARSLVRRTRADAVIAGEPSGWDGVTLSYKGDLRLEAIFRGERRHFSAPDPTTADRALAWIHAVKEVAAHHAGPTLFRSLTAKVVALTDGSYGDAERVRVVLDLRLPPGLSTSTVLGEIPAGPDGPRLRTLARIEPIELERTSPVASALTAAIRGEGGRPTLRHKAGTSDLNLVVPAWKIPGAAYGPGDSRLDHTPREVVAEIELTRSVRVLRTTFDSLRRSLPSDGS